MQIWYNTKTKIEGGRDETNFLECKWIKSSTKQRIYGFL